MIGVFVYVVVSLSVSAVYALLCTVDLSFLSRTRTSTRWACWISCWNNCFSGNTENKTTTIGSSTPWVSSGAIIWKWCWKWKIRICHCSNRDCYSQKKQFPDVEFFCREDMNHKLIRGRKDSYVASSARTVLVLGQTLVFFSRTKMLLR